MTNINCIPLNTTRRPAVIWGYWGSGPTPANAMEPTCSAGRKARQLAALSDHPMPTQAFCPSSIWLAHYHKYCMAVLEPCPRTCHREGAVSTLLGCFHGSKRCCQVAKGHILANKEAPEGPVGSESLAMDLQQGIKVVLQAVTRR